MNEQERAELDRLVRRQQDLQDRLKPWEARLQSGLLRLQASQQDFEELGRQYRRLQTEQSQLATQIASLRERLEAATELAAPPVQSEVVQEAASAAVPPSSPPVKSVPVAPPPLPSWVRPETPLPALASATTAEAEPPVIAPTLPVSSRRDELRASLIPGGQAGSRGTHGDRPSEPVEAPPTTQPESFELRLGTYWLARLGIVALLTGMVFLAGFAYKNYAGRIGPPGKVAVLYVLSFGLLGAGAWLYRRQESLKNYARVLVAGGLAAVYFTTYAAHHVANLQVIGSPVLDGALLLAWAGFIVWLADRMKSEVLALFATGLGYYTAVMTSVGSFTLYSNLVLTLAAVFFLVRNRWAVLSSVSLAATYFAYAFWRFYHQGEWRWATPDQGLWHGAWFLICYWVVFTAAVFLSKHEQFAGKNRATFATLNNGAFLGLFLLTMIQVRTGGFWKVALCSGAALLLLAALAARWLAAEKITSRAYLTQGLLLVTLGFVTHYSGTNLALVLAVESVALLVLGRLLDQPIMRVGAFVTGAMSLIWLCAGVEAFDRRGLIAGSVVGALMLFNAQWARQKDAAAAPALSFGLTFFTALAALAWAWITWRNVDDRWLAVPWAAESVIFLLASRPLGNRVLGYAAFPLALLATGAAATELLGQMRLEIALRRGAWAAVLAGGLVGFNAWATRREVKPADAPSFVPASAAFAAPALLIWWLTLWVFVPVEYKAVALAGAAAALTAAGLGLRMIEVTALAQGFLVFAQLHCLGHLLPEGLTVQFGPAVSLPWWNPAIVLVLTLAMSHGWQCWRLPDAVAAGRAICQGVYALAAVLVLLFWLRPHFTPAAWMALACLLTLAVTAYAVWTRAWWLAGAGQILLLGSLFEFLRQVVLNETVSPAWYYPLAPITAFVALPFFAAIWLAQKPDVAQQTGKTLAALGQVYQLVAGLLALAWVFEYVPARDRVWALMLVGAGLFFWAGWRQSRQALWASGVFTGIGFLVLWGNLESPAIVYVPNLFAVLLVLAQQQAARRFPNHLAVSEATHNTTMIVGGCSLGLLVSRWVLLESGGFYLTVAWAALALAIFAVGFGLRERMYRWLGLAVLACALGRVVAYDVWKLETLHRILSFMALGAVLLVLGFLYSRYQERIRPWL
jgi:hypothetical protein